MPMPILVRYGALVQPLLPPQRPPAGRPRHDHHTVLSGIIRVIRRRDSWRAVPRECGKWEMVYKRYQLWRAEGRWQRIAALGIEVCEVALQGCVSEVLAGRARCSSAGGPTRSSPPTGHTRAPTTPAWGE